LEALRRKTLTIFIILIAGLMFTQIISIQADPSSSYELSSGGVGTSELSTEQKYGGSYSVKLCVPNGAGSSDYGAVILHYGQSIDNIPTVASTGTYEVVNKNKLYFWARLSAATVPPSPYIILDVDTDGDGQREYALVSVGSAPTAGGAYSLDTWTQSSPKPDSDGNLGGASGWMAWDVVASAVVNVPGSDSNYEPLGYWKQQFIGATVLNIKIWYGEWSAVRTQDETAYVDDLTIDSSTCDFETGPSVTTSTGTGDASFTIDTGNIGDISSVAEAALPPAGKPNLDFTHGFFSFDITGVGIGGTVIVTMTFPTPIPTNMRYWKYHDPEGWIDVTALVGSNDGDNVITLTLTDGGLGDDDGIADGVILDQGGPGQPYPPSVGGEVYPVDKLALLTPYIATILVMVAASAAVIKRRKY